jgi:outer membrane protein TolC
MNKMKKFKHRTCGSSAASTSRTFNLKYFILFVWFVSFAVHSFGLTLDDAEKLAVNASRSVQSYALEGENDALANKEKLYEKLPSLGSPSVTAYEQLWDKDSKINNYGDYLKNNYYITVQPLNPSWTIDIYNRSKNIQDKIDDITDSETKNNALSAWYTAVNDADKDYIAVLENITDLQSKKAAYDEAKRVRTKTQATYDAGNSSRIDVLNAEVEEEKESNTVEQAARTLAESKTVLKKLLNLNDLPDLTPLNFDDYKELAQKLAAMEGDELGALTDNLFSRYKNKNPDYLNAGLTLANSKLNLETQKAGYIPQAQLDVGIPSPTLTLNSTTTKSGTAANGTQKMLGVSPLSLTLTVRLPSSGYGLDLWKTSNSVKQYSNKVKQAELEFSSTESSDEDTVRTNLSTLVTDAENALSAARSLDLEQLTWEYNQELFNQGNLSVYDYSQIQDDLLDAKIALNTAQCGFLNELALLRQACAFEKLSDTSDYLQNN